MPPETKNGVAPKTVFPSLAATVFPAVALAAVAWALAWVTTGSIDSSDWLPYAILAALLLAVAAVSSAGSRPGRAATAGIALLLAFACWQAVSIAWAALPSLARDDALLTLFYVVALSIGVLGSRGVLDRLVAAGSVAAGCGVLAIGIGLALRFGSAPENRFSGGRLTSPISYPNGLAAMFLVGFWPAIVIAGRRTAPVLVRACGVGIAAALGCGWLLTQSKGGGIALGISALLLFALARDRLRLVIPTAIVAVLVGPQFSPLTSAFGENGSALRHAARHAGTTVLWVTAAAAVAGAVYALLDRRFALPPRARKLTGRLALAAVLVAVVALPVAFFATVNHPGRFVADKWSAFKHQPKHETAATHFATLGSNRYDFWRVALDQFRRHPVAGIGGRGFGPAYLIERRSGETPARAHSFELDALSELGIVGLVLLVGGLAPLVWLVARAASLGDAAGTAAFGTAAYWLVHASADWIWTIPATGVPFFLLLGVGIVPVPWELGRAARIAVAGLAVLAAVLAFLPPWLSSQLSSHALATGSPSGLHWARKLDPLSVEPYRVEAAIAPTPQDALPPLLAAVRKEPRSADLHFELGIAYERAGRRDAARRAIQEALRLEPREDSIVAALKRISRR
jgi:hypothetical protein